MKKILVLTDNTFLYNKFLSIIDELLFKEEFVFAHSPGNILFLNEKNIIEIDLNKQLKEVISEYRLFFSIHSKQFFPRELVQNTTCINIHPGYNPHNRGWYPQVFSIINDEIIGATIHVMDARLDHGQIIDRKKVVKYLWDTSESVYNRVLDAEIDLLKKNIRNIIEGNFKSFNPEFEGKLYQRRDFNSLCKIDLNEKGTFLEFYNRLRALTHGNYKNAYFIDPDSGKKIFLSINTRIENE